MSPPDATPCVAATKGACRWDGALAAQTCQSTAGGPHDPAPPVLTEAIVLKYGRDVLLRRLTHPRGSCHSARHRHTNRFYCSLLTYGPALDLTIPIS
jgi:hypothetical protein